MSFLGFLQKKRQKIPMTESAPTIPVKHPLLTCELPSSKEELVALHIELGKQMSEMNHTINQVTQKIVILSQKGYTEEAYEQLQVKSQYAHELKAMNDRLLEVMKAIDTKIDTH